MLLCFPAVTLLGLLIYAHGFYKELPPDARGDRVVVNKLKRRMAVFSQGETVRVYRIALGKVPRGAKRRQGDQKTPEGEYIIDYRNAGSVCHRSLHISYPNEEDTKQAIMNGYSPGGDITIHGLPNGFGFVGRLHRWFDWTSGCIAVTNREIEELWRILPADVPIVIKSGE